MSDWNAARRAALLAALPGIVRVLTQADLAALSKDDQRFDAGIEVDRQLADQHVTLRVALSTWFPFELPFILVDRNALPQFLPHVERNGNICYYEREGAVMRFSEAGHIVEDALSLALDTLQRSLSGANAGDVFDELEAYWRGYATTASPCFVEHDDRLSEVIVGFKRREKNEVSFRYVASRFEDVTAFDPKAKRESDEKLGLLVPLNRSALQEPFDPELFCDAAWIRGYVSRHVDENVARQIAPLAKRASWPFVVLSVPRVASGRSLVGLHYTQSKGHPLLADATKEPVRIVTLERRNRSALVVRGGATRSLNSVRIAVVGCGAIGGHLAVNLATSGVGTLHLIDPDDLKSENTFRHACGRRGVGEAKVRAVKSLIESRFPYVNVTTDKRRAQDAISTGDLRWTDYDAVVVTVGDVVESRRLNDELARANVARVFTWLEPLGIGGHALLVRDVEQPGCYECLFRDRDGEEVLHNIADFAAPGQVFSKSQAGCGGRFTPYGALDAIRTAELAARLTLAALADQERRHPLLSWKGDATEFLRHYKLAPRYQLNETQLAESCEQYACARCPVCAARS